MSSCYFISNSSKFDFFSAPIVILFYGLNAYLWLRRPRLLSERRSRVRSRSRCCLRRWPERPMRSLGSPPGSDTSSSPCPDGAARGSGGGVSPGLSCTAGSAAIASEGVVPAGFEFEFRLFTLDKF